MWAPRKVGIKLGLSKIKIVLKTFQCGLQISMIWNTSYSATREEIGHSVLILGVLCTLYKKCITNKEML